MSLNELGGRAHENAVAKGFYDPPPTLPEYLCAIHSEVSEAFEAYRDDHRGIHFAADGKPEGMPIELADAIIRIVDMAAYLGIDLDEAAELKMAYNATRARRHGRKVL